MVSPRNVQGRSLEFLDALYAVQKLPVSMALLEMLALPGDVSLIVSEPELPDLWTLPGSYIKSREIMQRTCFSSTSGVEGRS